VHIKQHSSKLTLTTLIVAVVAGIVLPHLARRDVRLLAQSDDEDEDSELARLRDTVRQWQAEAARQGKPLRLPVMPFLLRNIWMGAMLLFSLIAASTFFITKVWQVGFRSFSDYLLPTGVDFLLGYLGCQLDWYLLGSRLLGTLRPHNGGLSLHVIPVYLITYFFLLSPVPQRIRPTRA
jgi:hypothetical protein